MSTKNLKKILEAEFGSPCFGGFLRSARTIKDLTQVEMAEVLGIKKGTLCDIEKGRQIVSIELAAKIAKKCKLPVELAVEYAINDQIAKANLKLKASVS